MYDENDINEDGVAVIRVPYFETYRNLTWYPAIYAVASWSEKQEQSFELLSFVWQNAEASNLLRYGREGKDYEVDEAGFAVSLNGQNLMDYYSPFGNSLLTTPVAPFETANKVEDALALWDKLKPLPIDGFVFDPTPVQGQVQMINDICSDITDLKVIFCSPSEQDVTACLSQYNEKLKAAGIDDVIAEVNRQLKAYIKE
jgi:putative aldouronate transport system substrate-binding protein